MRSLQLMFEGGQELHDAMKRSSKSIVRVTTDDAEISVGHLVFNNGSLIRVATQVYDRNKRGLRTHVYEINARRVSSCIVLN